METKARKITNFHSGVSAVAAFITQPVPALDELIVVPIHYRMCKKLAKLHGIDKRDLPWPQIRKIIWYGAAARLGANFAIGLVPVVGMFSNAITAIALTEYLGQYIEQAVAQPGVPAPEVTMAGLKQMFEEAVRRYAERKAAKEGA